MMKFVRYLLMAKVFVLSLSSHAQWTSPVPIKNIIWKPSYHGFYVEASDYQDPAGCAAAGNRLYLIDPALETNDPKTTDRLYSMLLTAMTTGKPVHIWLNGCTDGRPRFNGLQLNHR